MIKKLIASICMLLLTGTLLGTSTYAWFSMNSQVSATGMQIEAVAEDGILIINELDADAAENWKVSTTASYHTAVGLAPISSANLTDWFHNSSDDQNDAKAGQLASTYETLSSNSKWTRDEGSMGVYYMDLDEDATWDNTKEKAYVLLNKFYIKSSGNQIDLGDDQTYKDVYVNHIEVTSTTTNTPELNAALRVAVKVGDTITIYAPVTGATLTYMVGGSDSGTEVTAIEVPDDYIVDTPQNVTSIPAITTAKADALEVDVFLYFEGEDLNLKSVNLKETLDTLNVSIALGIVKEGE